MDAAPPLFDEEEGRVGLADVGPPPSFRFRSASSRSFILVAMSLRTPSKALKREVEPVAKAEEPAAKAEERTSRVGERCWSILRSCIPSARHQPFAAKCIGESWKASELSPTC